MIPLTKPYFRDKDIDKLKKVFSSGWVAGQGPENNKLANLIKKQCDVNYAIPVNNCTAALHLSLLGIGVQEGEEILVSDYTYPAPAYAILYCKAKPVFVDVRLDTYNMDSEDLEKKITDKSKAIIVVHQFGLAANMDSIMRVAKKHNLRIIEDAACAYGAKYKQRPIGSFGDLGCFSFHGRKNVTCGEGGAIVTNNKKYAENTHSLSCFGIMSAYKRNKTNNLQIPKFSRLGYNYKLSDLNASLAYSQITHSKRIIEEKRRSVIYYREKLRDLSWLQLPSEPKDCYHAYQSFVCTIVDNRIKRNKLINKLRDQGIQANIGTYACHIQEVFKTNTICPNSKFLYDNAIALPLYVGIKKEELDYIIESLYAYK